MEGREDFGVWIDGLLCRIAVVVVREGVSDYYSLVLLVMVRGEYRILNFLRKLNLVEI